MQQVVPAYKKLTGIGVPEKDTVAIIEMLLATGVKAEEVWFGLGSWIVYDGNQPIGS